MADAATSLLAIIGLSVGWIFGWIWMDAVVGIIGALVIANWSYGLIRAAGGVLLDATTFSPSISHPGSSPFESFPLPHACARETAKIKPREHEAGDRADRERNCREYVEQLYG
jgi:hypothetical protein